MNDANADAKKDVNGADYKLRTGFSIASRIRSVIALPAFLVILIVSSVFAITLFILSFGKLKNWLICHVGRFIGMAMLTVLGVNLEVNHGRHNRQTQAVYIVNHSSTLDLFIIIALGLPRIRYVAKYELQLNPFFFVLGRITGQIFINRKDSASSVNELKKSYDRVMRHDLSVLVAPEGSRKHEMPVGVFKKGAFRIAQDLDLPVVPVFIEGAWDLCPGASMLSHPGTVRVWFDQPHDFSGLDDVRFNKKIEELRQIYRRWITEGYNPYQNQ
jgi:1-acyl-sn-glycerol-3-phosphate acyltransferase